MAMPDYADSYYSQTLSDRHSRPALEGTVNAPVCIIGGGLAGINVALGLAERGMKSVVLESRRVGWGASGRNGGIVLAGFAANPEKMIRRAGLATTQKLFALTRAAQILIRHRITRYGIECDVRDGMVYASWYDDADNLKADQEFEDENFGLRPEFWSREKVRDLYKTGRYYDALYYPDFFHLHPLNYLRGLARAAEALGAKIYEQTPALSVTSSSGKFVIKTPQGQITASQIVHCGSAYGPAVSKPVSRSFLPISSYIMVTDPLPPELLARAIVARHAVFDNRWACNYYRVLPDNSILWGGGVGFGRDHLPHNLGQRMMADMLRVYPQLAGIGVRSVWTGTMASTIRRVAHVGHVGPRQTGEWFCTHFGNNGIGPTTAAGEVIAAAIATNDETYKLFESFGLEYGGGPLAPFAAQGLYRFWQLRDCWQQFHYS